MPDKGRAVDQKYERRHDAHPGAIVVQTAYRTEAGDDAERGQRNDESGGDRMDRQETAAGDQLRERVVDVEQRRLVIHEIGESSRPCPSIHEPTIWQASSTSITSTTSDSHLVATLMTAKTMSNRRYFTSEIPTPTMAHPLLYRERIDRT